MTKAFRLDVATCQQQLHLNWIELLAFLGARYGGDFSSYLEATWMNWPAVCRAAFPWSS